MYPVPAARGRTYNAATAASNGLLANLVAYWGLDEAAGANNALDKHSGGLTLTQVGSPGSAAGKVYAKARTFNGSNQWLSRADEASLSPGDNDFSIAAWVYLSNTSTQHTIAGKYQLSGNQREYLLYWNHNDFAPNDCFTFSVSPDGVNFTRVAATAFGVPSLNSWHFVVAHHDATRNKIGISINAGSVDESDHATGIFDSTATLFLGALANDFWMWSGRIGPVAMWKSAAGGGGVLSAAQRTALYNAGDGLAYAAFTA